MASITALAGRVKADPSLLIAPEVVEEACADARHHWRERCLGPLETLRAFVTQIAHGNTAISHVVRLCGGAFSESAYCQARARLPLGVVRAATEAFTERIRAASGATDDGGRWCGHRTALIDGTGVVMPDTPGLREHFGTAARYAPGCGLPLASVLTVFDAANDLLLDLHAAPAHTQDLKHVHEVHPALAPGDVLVGDAGLGSYVHLAILLRAGIYGVFRMNSSRAMPFPAKTGERERRTYNRHRRQEPLLVRLIGQDDQVVELVKPHNCPKQVTPEVFATLPSKMIVRALRYKVEQAGWRSSEIVLLTTLLDPEKYSAEALAALYLSRWRVEVNLRHLKRTLGMDRLTCHSVEGVLRELWVFALVYNAVCALRVSAASAQGVVVHRVSFIDALRWWLIETRGTPRSVGQPTSLKLWPLRASRSHPRFLKRLPSSFKVMPVPRSQVRRYATKPP